MRYVRRATENQAAVDAMLAAGYPSILARVLSMRGVTGVQEAEAFLSPSLDQLIDPFEMKGMREAVDMLRGAIADKKRIVVFGDYDVDGVTATAAMLSQLRDMGADAGYYLPNRHGEGYGLNETSVRSLSKAYDLMITVDCGITSIREVALAKEQGMEVLVTDHHEPLDALPDCLCLNPKLGYPFRDLCGAGVAGKLIEALGGREALLRVLDLVALGTIADIVPLLGENRALASEGLALINRDTRAGIAALIEVSGLLGKEITAGHVSFAIAPRINAGGRIGHSGKSVEMMLTRDRRLALDTARELDGLNRERQRQEQAILEDAIRQAEAEDLRSARALVLTGEDWNPGVIGIVASRIVERYSRPAVLLAREGDAYVGSGRSVPGVHLFDALQSVSDLFVRFGGHEMAAGMTILPENIAAFRRGLQASMEQLDAELFLPTALYDLEARLPQIDLDTVKKLTLLAPNGQSNPSPIFLLRGANLSSARTIGAERAHLRVLLSQDGVSANGTAFRMGKRLDEASGSVDALVVPEVDSYTGVEQVKLIVRSFARASGVFAGEVRARADDLIRLSLESIDCRAQGGGFRRHIQLKGLDQLKEMLLGVLGQTVGGVLIACALPQTALEMDAWLASTPLDAMVKRCVGEPPQDIAAPHALCCPALNDAQQLSGYSQIVLPDGVWNSAWVEALLQLAPGAAVYAPAVADGAREAVAQCVPTIEQVRSLYRLLRAQAVRVEGIDDFGAFRSAVGSTGMAGAALSIALSMLADMELVDLSSKPFRLSVVQGIQGKRDFEGTPTYRFYSEFCGDYLK